MLLSVEVCGGVRRCVEVYVWMCVDVCGLLGSRGGGGGRGVFTMSA